MSTLTAEMIVNAMYLDDARISPDGAQVAFVAMPSGQKEAEPQSAIWLAKTGEPGSARKLTAGTAADTAPRWQPDGQALLFLSDRKERGVAQLYRIDPRGGEATRLTEVGKGVAAVQPLPGSTCVAILACDPESEEAKQRKENRDDAEVYGQNWPWQRLSLLDLGSGELTPVPEFGDRHIVEVAASSDGTRLAVIAWPTPDPDNMTGTGELLVIDLSSRAITSVTSLTAQTSSICWGPDDRELLYVARRGPRMQGSHTIYAVDPVGGAPRAIAPDLPACIANVAVSRSGNVFALVDAGLDGWIGRVDLERGQIHRLHDVQGNAWCFTVSDDGRTVALLRRTRQTMTALWAGSTDGELLRLTDWDAELETLPLGRQEAFTWSAPDGLEIQGVLVLPVGATREDGPFPLFTLAHGGPYWRFCDELQIDWWQWGQWLANVGYAVFHPNPRGSSGRGDDFARLAVGDSTRSDWADIESGIDALVRQGIADPDRLGIGGWSYGGYMTSWGIGQTRRFKVGVMLAGVTDLGMMTATSDIPSFARQLSGSAAWEGVGPHLHAAVSPISFAHAVDTPLLILHGEADDRVPVSQGRFYAQALRAKGTPCELVIYPREPHALLERAHQLDLLHRVRAWVERWLGPGMEYAASASI